MHDLARWTRIMAIGGFAAMILGLVDPMEGSLILLAGCGLAALSALLSHSQHRMLLFWAFGLMAVGVAAMWGLSSIGGFGGTSGRSNWLGLLILPYPVGWLMGIVGAFRRMREANRGTQSHSPSA